MLVRLSLIGVLAAVAIPSAAQAADSSWLVCKGIATHGDTQKTFFVANVLEHRYEAVKRALDVTLIYGANVSTGEVTDIAAGTLRATSVDNKHVVFVGTGKLSEGFKTFTLVGKIDFDFGGRDNPRMDRFTAKLSCEQLDDLAIGH